MKSRLLFFILLFILHSELQVLRASGLLFPENFPENLSENLSENFSENSSENFPENINTLSV